jgi:hypothetical protein
MLGQPALGDLKPDQRIRTAAGLDQILDALVARPAAGTGPSRAPNGEDRVGPAVHRGEDLSLVDSGADAGEHTVRLT